MASSSARLSCAQRRHALVSTCPRHSLPHPQVAMIQFLPSRLSAISLVLSCFTVCAFAQTPPRARCDTTGGRTSGQARCKENVSQGQGSREATGRKGARTLQAWRDFGGRRPLFVQKFGVTVFETEENEVRRRRSGKAGGDAGAASARSLSRPALRRAGISGPEFGPGIASAFTRTHLPDEIWLRCVRENEKAWRWYERGRFCVRKGTGRADDRL